MNKIKNFNLPEHTNKLYKDEAISSISLTREIADKINELVEAYNTLSKLDLEWKQNIEGTVAKGVIYMKDNLINSIHDLLYIIKDEMIENRIEVSTNELSSRLDNLIGLVKAGTTSMDAEIIDGRVDPLGVIKENIGENIRDIFKLFSERLKEKTLDGVLFYESLANVSYLGDVAPNRVGSKHTFNIDKDILANAPKGYLVSVTVWNGPEKIGDTGWLEKVVIPKGFDVKFGLRKSNDEALPITDIFKIDFKVESVEINGFNASNQLEYTSGGYYSNIRLCGKYVTVEKPITIICPDEYSVAAKVYRIDSGSRVYQRDSGWVKTFTLQTNLEYEINFKKDDNSMLFKSDLLNITFTDNIVKNDNVKSIAHRGYNIGAPENTLSAYKLAKKNGFKYVEADVSFTKDNIAVLLHDDTIDRTSNGSGSISSKTYSDVSKLDFGSWFSDDYAGERIPTFEEFIILCRNLGIHPYIEIKYGATQSQVESLVDIVAQYGMKGKVTYISFETNLLNFVYNKDKNARLGFVTNTFTSTELAKIKTMASDGKLFIDLNISNVTDTIINLAIENDLPVEVWSVNNANNILNTNAYVSGFTTDYVLTECLFSEV